VDKPVSRIVLGSMVFRPGMVPYFCAMFDHFYAQGGNCIDTAYVYGTEATVGEGLRTQGLRDQVVLIGKGAHTPFCTPKGLTDQLYQTLDRLQTDYLDIYMLHRDNPDVPVGEFVEVLNEHLRAGRIRAFGGSNWTTERLAAANAYAAEHGLIGFAASSPNLALARWNEPMWAGCVSASDAEARAWYTETQMPLFSWSSQASGFTTGRFSPDDRDNPALSGIARTWFNAENWERLRRSRELAAKKGVGPTQIALAWVLNQPFPTHALIGPRTIDEMRSSIEALQVELTPEEMAWLDLEG
jgi:aryl-alcohol dehydrogenase-like predicted oxidoreductase